jgi:hypothetical protein
MSRRRLIFICCLACIIILGPQPLATVQAALPIDNPFLVVSYAQDAGATYPTLAYNPQNQEYLLVWCHQKAGSVAIYAETISKTGVLSSVYPVSETATDIDRCKPDVAYNSTDHNYLVVWEDVIVGPQFGVHGRVFTPGGALGQEIEINTSDSVTFVYPAVAYSSTSNEFLVVWTNQPYGLNNSIKAQRLSNTGVKLGGNYTVAQGQNQIQNYDPDVAYNPARNEYLVVWTSLDNGAPGGPNKDIFGQIYTHDLIPLGIKLEIGYHTIQEYVPAVAAIQTPAPESGRYMVVWEVLYSNGDHDVWQRIVKGDGSMMDVGIISASYLDERAPAVTGNMHSNFFLVSWNSTYGPAYPLNIGVKACNVTLEGRVFGKDWAGGIKSGMSAVASGPGNQFQVVFEDTTFFANADLFGRFWADRAYVPVIKK